MNLSEFIDYTNLKKTATAEDIMKLCEEAKKYHFPTVCVSPYYVKAAAEYLKGTLNRITCVGAVFLSLIAILPMLLRFSDLNLSFGGTSILILVGVAIETVQQLESLIVIQQTYTNHFPMLFHIMYMYYKEVL